jgi:hypothetical protein
MPDLSFFILCIYVYLLFSMDQGLQIKASYLILSYLILSYLILSYLIMPVVADAPQNMEIWPNPDSFEGEILLLQVGDYVNCTASGRPTPNYNW